MTGERVEFLFARYEALATPLAQRALTRSRRNPSKHASDLPLPPTGHVGSKA